MLRLTAMQVFGVNFAEPLNGGDVPVREIGVKTTTQFRDLVLIFQVDTKCVMKLINKSKDDCLPSQRASEAFAEYHSSTSMDESY